jgi:hypothetical protein
MNGDELGGVETRNWVNLRRRSRSTFRWPLDDEALSVPSRRAYIRPSLADPLFENFGRAAGQSIERYWLTALVDLLA